MIQDDFGNLVDLTTAATIHARLDDGDQRLSRVEAEQIALRRELEANTLATQAVKADTAELVELFQSFKGAIKVLNWLGKLANWQSRWPTSWAVVPHASASGPP